MSTNGANGEDTEMAECEGEKVVTMMDVLQEQQEFEEDANAVLGASDDKNCTYSKGYIKRQAVYACLTCCNDAKHDPDKRAGVCLACSLTCHENHELVELYTKRNFRCDCGNPKFNHPCQYTENKASLNDENIYNQNFSGLYCTCHRPYPDPDGVEEEMIQCIICEDWLHSSHLEATVPSPELYAEMICKACMDKNEFLHDYSKYAVNGEVDIVGISEENSDTTVNGNSNEMNGVAVETGKAENEKIAESDKLTKPDNTPEAIITSHDIMDEKNPKEETEPNQPVIEKNGDEDPVTEKADDGNQSNDENKTESVVSNENSVENNLAADIVSDKADDEHQPKGNQDDKPSHDISDNKLDTITDSPGGSGDQENIDTTENKDDGTTDVNVADLNQQEIPQNCNESSANDGEQAEDKTDKDGNIASQEKQEDLAESTVMDDNNANTETLPVTEEIKDSKRKLSIEESTPDATAKKPKLSESECLRPQGERKMFKGATFWPCHFRQKLCTCNECITMYRDLSVLFLTDPEDTVTAYEVLGKEKTDGAATTQYEKGLEALSSLGRIQQINALTEYNKMRDKLLDFLKSFKDRKEVVKEEDIKAFFAGMKPKREPDGVYFCR